MEDFAPPPQPPGRDSLKNGAIIGAVITGSALAVMGSYVCIMLREPGDPPCWKSVLPVSAIAAGIGAAAGAGIDALASRPQSVQLAPPLQRSRSGASR